MRINLGCGKHTWRGYYCIDAEQHPKATRPLDLQHAFEFSHDGTLKNPLPLQSGCAQELCNYHFLEHFYHWQAPALMHEMHRLLAPGGQLIIELPNLLAAAKNLLDGTADNLSYWPLYGDPIHKNPYMCHRWGYTPQTLTALLIGTGFKNIQQWPPQSHGARTNRDMRFTANK